MPAAFRPVLLLVAAIWVVEVANQALGHRLNIWLGLEPRDPAGLIGIPAMPLLHGGIAHAAANTLPIVVLGGIGVTVARKRFVTASLAIVAASGLAVWLAGRPGTLHVGASGLVFGWFGFLVALGFIERSLRAIAGSVLVLLLYGGMIWGMLPQQALPVSWEAHLFGAMTGTGAAWLFRARRPLR